VFGPGVTVTDTALLGYVWGENIGWINLSPAQYDGIANDNGMLTGYAWGENVGWINFQPANGGVNLLPIDSHRAKFNGWAWGENIGWIHFNSVVPVFYQVVTLVTLESLEVLPGNAEITLLWVTSSEINNAGYNVYRAVEEDGEYEKINETLIPAQGSATQGASYSYTDDNVQNRKTYYYKLEDIDLNGNSTMHGPVSATPRLIYGLVK
jgi:hypothetical protein